MAITGYFSIVVLQTSGQVAVSLPFSPVKLLLLIGWFYLCLYCVQIVQFSPLVPDRKKPLANIVTLIAGPILLIVLTVSDVIKKTSQSEDNIFVAFKKRFHTLLQAAPLVRRKSNIKLLDTTGRNINDIYGKGKGTKESSRALALTEQLVIDALDERASDILIDPKTEDMYSIRFRVDGVLNELDQIESDMARMVINCVKAVANMDIAEKRRPQDGSFIAKTTNSSASFRVASAGAHKGEKLIIRVLNRDAGKFMLANIGMASKQCRIVEKAISKPNGMVLMCGPTGSGKTTTLYAMLNNIDLFTRNVITVEDPIEYELENASQIEVNPKADITFANSLRSILRQDPDVICVGEIRDEETAGIALRAAQTGHLVLATIHSNSTGSALIRLLDLGVSPLLLSAGLELIISQRLVRKLCEHCKIPAKLTQTQIHNFKKRKINYLGIHEAVGCYECNGTGYFDRIAIYDILELDDKLKAAIVQGKLSLEQLRKEGDQRGKSNLQKQGLKRAVSGITSLDELDRVIG